MDIAVMTVAGGVIVTHGAVLLRTAIRFLTRKPFSMILIWVSSVLFTLMGIGLVTYVSADNPVEQERAVVIFMFGGVLSIFVAGNILILWNLRRS